MIPVHKEIRELIGDSYKGNFGLWFNKFVELDNDSFKVPNNFISKYTDNKDNSLKTYFSNILEKKHLNQLHFCKTFSSKYDVLTIVAKLTSPFITGIGQTHPCEVGMTFDHTIGLPYIPASSIKGIVRFSHTLSIIDEAIKRGKVNKDYYFDDEDDWTNIPKMFGKGGDKGNMGSVIFLDAYPENIPNLKEDIMNPHYGPYYLERKAPGDYHNPVPIKFLTVEKGTRFIFRALILKSINKDGEIFNLVKDAFKEALTTHGVGAKTAVGYGRFSLEDFKEPKLLLEKFNRECVSDEEKLRIKKEEYLKKLSKLQKESTEVDNEFDKWLNSDLKDDLDIAQFFEGIIRKKKADKSYTSNYQKIAEILGIDLSFEGKTSAPPEATTNDDSELEKARKRIQKANGNQKEIKKILKNCSKSVRKQLEKEFGIS